MNEIIFELSEGKDFFTNEILAKEDMVMVPLFPITESSNSVYNYVITSKERLEFLKSYKPTAHDVMKLTERNHKLLDRLGLQYNNLNKMYKANMRDINFFRQADRNFVEELMTEEERESFNGNFKTATELRVVMSEVKAEMIKLENSISSKYYEKALTMDFSKLLSNLERE